MTDPTPDVYPPRYEQVGNFKQTICDEPEWIARPAAWGIDELPEPARGRKWNLYNAHFYGWLAGFIACPVCRPHVREILAEDGLRIPAALVAPEGDWRAKREWYREWYAASHPSGRCEAEPFIRCVGHYECGIVTHSELFNRTLEELFALPESLDRKDGFPHRTKLRGLKARELALELVGPNPFRPVAFSPEWRTDTAVALARQMYDAREFGATPILADALQDAGCDSEAILTHCRSAEQVHVRGCWVIDLVLGKS